PVSILDLRADNAVQISLLDYGRANSYPLDSVADGLQLWAQLAVLEAADSLRIIHSQFDLRLAILISAVRQFADETERRGLVEDYLFVAESEDDHAERAELMKDLAAADESVAAAEAAARQAAADYEQLIDRAADDWQDQLMVPPGQRYGAG